MADIGDVSLFFSFFLAIYVIVASILSINFKSKRLLLSSENAVFSISLLLTLAVVALLYELVNLNFNLRYVALNTSTDLPVVYRITALWAGNSGSLLLWSFIFSWYFSFSVIISKKKDLRYRLYINILLAAIAAFFIFLITFVENPFERLEFTPQEGRGLNPILQNIYMITHPVFLYLGYVGLAIPFAYGMAAVIVQRKGIEWVKESRRWFLLAWTFLSIGLLLGARWAYLELGWGGYWAWDPVENAAFMPWLTGTAFIHSVMVQEKRGILKKWNIILLSTTFFLAIFGTFLTRSGIVSSVHSFSQSDIGAFFLVFLSLILLFSFVIMIYRTDYLKNEEEGIESVFSRESAFVFNNLLFLGAAFAVFLGTIFPIISEALTGEKILVGAPYFNRVNVPIGLVLILLMGVAPLIPWRKMSLNTVKKNFFLPLIISGGGAVALFLGGIRDVTALISFVCCIFVTVTILAEFYKGVMVRKKKGEGYFTGFMTLISRNKRRYGGYVVHLGVVLIVIGITASSIFSIQKEFTLRTGEKTQLGEYEIRFKGFERYVTDAKNATIANVDVYRDGSFFVRLKPEKNIFLYEGNRDINQETEVALESTLTHDLYLVLTDFDKDKATFRLFINPMVSWIWSGGFVVLLGIIIAVWPKSSFMKELVN